MMRAFIAAIAAGMILSAPLAAAGSLQRFDAMTGNWQGGGWMQRGPERSAFTGHESVRYVLDGTALLIEGRHFTEREGRQVPAHTALALIRAVPRSEGEYSIHSWLSDGRDIEGWARWAGEEFHWGFSLPERRREIRYRIRIDGDRWTEVGETRAGTGEWVKFFEMRMQRLEGND